MLILRIQDLLPLALLFKWRPMSQVHDQKEHSLQSHLNYEELTIFIGGSEVVLNSFDDISLDILFFLESNGSSVDKLSIFILSNGGRA